MAAASTPVKLNPSKLYQKLKELVPDWELLGIHLGVPLDTLKKFNASAANKPIEIKFQEVIKCFMSEGGDDCTWSTIIDAVKAIGNNRLARQIKEKHGEGKITMDPVDLVNELKECLPDWSMLGLMLGIDKTQIETIDARDPFPKKLLDVLSYWLGNSKDCSWEAMIKAVNDVGNKRLANQLSTEFLGK